MAGALPQESGLFSLVEMETADETVLVAVPMTTEIRGRTRRDSAEWAKEVFHQHKKNVKSSEPDLSSRAFLSSLD